MTTMRGSTHYEVLLPFEPSDEPPPIRPTIVENDWSPNGQPSLRKRASRALSRFLLASCIGVAATLAWQSYGDAAREMAANSSPAFIWLAPPAAPNVQVATDQVTQAPATSSFDRQPLKAAPLDPAATQPHAAQQAPRRAGSVGSAMPAPRLAPAKR